MPANSFQKICLFLIGLIPVTVCAQSPKLIIPVGHSAQVLSTVFSPDGKMVITVSQDGTAKLWETFSGRLLRNYKTTGDASAAMATGAAFTSNGDYIIINYESGGMIITESNDGKVIWDWSGTAANAYHLDAEHIFDYLSPDARRVVMRHPYFGDTVLNLKLPVVYNTKDRRPLFSLKGYEDDINSMTYTTDGKQVIAVCADSMIRSWNANTGQLVRSLKFKTNDITLKQRCNDPEQILFSVDSVFTLVNINSGTRVSFPKRLKGEIEDIWYELSPGGKTILALSGFQRSETELSSNGYSKATLLNTVTSQQVFSIHGLLQQDVSSLFSLDGAKITFTTKDKSVLVINAHNGKQVRKLTNLPYLAESVFYSSDDTRAMVLLRNRSFLVWDPATKKMNPAFNADTSSVSAELLADDEDNMYLFDKNAGRKLYSPLRKHEKIMYDYYGKHIINNLHDRQAIIFDIASGKQLADIKGDSIPLNNASLSLDGTSVAVAYPDSMARIFDVASGKMISEMKGLTGNINHARFSKDGSRILMNTDDGKKILNVENGELTTAFSEVYNLERSLFDKDVSWREHMASSPDGRIHASWGADILEVTGETGLKKGFGPVNGRMDTGVKNVVFGPDNKKLLVTMADNTVRIYDLINEKFISTIMLFDSTDYINQLSTGYYQGTLGAVKKLHFVSAGPKVISFEQLDIKYNRPDKVLAAFGSIDTALTRSYFNAYAKRVTKLGIDTSAFRDDYSLPEADFINRDQIRPIVKERKVMLHIKGTDQTTRLDRFNIWINEVPLFGIKGFNIRYRNKNIFDTTLAINLSTGENIIETSVTNISGIESYRKPVSITYNNDWAHDSKVYFIGIGNNNFADSTYNLKWCVQDIRDLTTTLQKRYGSRLMIVDTLFDEKATWANIKKIKSSLLQTSVDDKVIISFSGHGLLSKNYDYYLSSYTVNFSDPAQGGIPYGQIENMLDSIPARKKILLLDACHSGEVDKEEMKKIEASSATLEKNHTVISTEQRGVKVTSNDTEKMSLQNSFELMQSLFVNVSKGTGAVVIAASGGVQFAQERSELGHGVFTYSIIEALKADPLIKVSALKKSVDESVTTLTNGLQKPTTRSELISIDWEL